MKKHNPIKMGLMLLALSNQAFAALKLDIKKDASTGKLEVMTCDDTFAVGTWIGFQIENGITQIETVNSNKCAIKTYSRDSLTEGKVLKIYKMRGRSQDTESLIKETVLRPNHNSSSAGTSNQSSTVISGIKFTVTTVENREGQPYKIKIKACHDQFKPSDAVSVTNRSTMGSQRPISKPSFVTRDKCFDVEFIKGEIQDGDEIGIGLASLPGSVAAKVYGVPWRRDQNTRPNNPVQPPIVTPPPGHGGGNPPPVSPQLPTEPAREVRENARRAAEMMARNVSKSLGQVENIRYNLFLGFREEEQRANYYGDRIQDHREYRYQFEQGVRSGESDGYRAGQVYAGQTAREYANTDVGAAVDAVMAGQSQDLRVNRRQNLGQMPFSGLDLQEATPAGVVERLKQKDQQLQADLSRRFYTIDSEIVVADDILTGRFEIYKLYGQEQYQFDLLNSYFREQKAFQYFVKGYFQPRQGLRNYYERITNANQYANATENARLFRQEFEDIYDRVINREWNEVVRKQNYEIQRVGRDLYAQLTAEYAAARGQFDGRKRGYKVASQSGFRQHIQQSYDVAVEQVVRDIQSRAVLADYRVQAISADGDLEVTIGDSIDLVLKSAANRGAVAGNLIVEPVNSNEVVGLKPSVSVQIPAFSKLNQEMKFNSMLFVSRLSAPDQNLSVHYRVNGESRQSQLRSSFEGLIVGLARQTNPQVQNAILQHVVGFLKSEWESEKSLLGNGFDDNKGNLLVERLANRTLAMSAMEKAAIKRYSQQIKSAYGERPGFMNGYRGDYDSVMDILKRAGLL